MNKYFSLDGELPKIKKSEKNVIMENFKNTNKIENTYKIQTHSDSSIDLSIIHFELIKSICKARYFKGKSEINK